jgi:hypothetical protein
LSCPRYRKARAVTFRNPPSNKQPSQAPQPYTMPNWLLHWRRPTHYGPETQPSTPMNLKKPQTRRNPWESPIGIGPSRRKNFSREALSTYPGITDTNPSYPTHQIFCQIFCPLRKTQTVTHIPKIPKLSATKVVKAMTLGTTAVFFAPHGTSGLPFVIIHSGKAPVHSSRPS